MVVKLESTAPSATLDTNVPVEYWKAQARVKTVMRLLDYAAAGLVDLAVTRHIEQDIPDLPLAAKIAKLPDLGIALAPAVMLVGSGKIGVDVIGSDAFAAVEAEIVAAWKTHNGKLPGPLDRLHLHAHYVQGRDLFVTWDKPVRGMAEMFTERGIPIAACAPEALATRLRLEAPRPPRGPHDVELVIPRMGPESAVYAPIDAAALGAILGPDDDIGILDREADRLLLVRELGMPPNHVAPTGSRTRIVRPRPS